MHDGRFGTPYAGIQNSKHHVIRLEEVHQIPYDRDVYRNIGAPPRWHVYCSCQWEGWTHDKSVALQFIKSHTDAQLARGQTIEVVGVDMSPVAEAAGNAELIAAQKPTEADAPVVGVDVEKDGYPNEIKGREETEIARGVAGTQEIV